jgi:anti-anti-sigma factor
MLRVRDFAAGITIRVSSRMPSGETSVFERGRHMRMTEQRHDRVTVLCMDGRIDAVTSPAFEAALLDMIRRGDRCIVLDMAGVDYISSAGLRVLLIGARKMKDCLGSICLAALRTSIKDILAVTGFLNLFRIFRSRENAVDELTENP